MQKRRSLILAAFVILFLISASIVGMSFWPKRDPSKECFDRIHVGMPFQEAERIVKEYGFVWGKGGGVESNEATLVFERAGSRAINIGVRKTGKVSYKELGEVPERENLFIRLWRRITGQR